MANGLTWAAIGTGFTFLMTAMGAGTVFFFRKSISLSAQRIFLGFAAGVMIAASVWSLILPAIEEAEAMGQSGLLPAAGGFALGVGFMLLMDAVMPHLHIGGSQPEGLAASWKRSTLLFSAVTLHNIPEGLAVGVAFGAVGAGIEGATIPAAIALAIGMGIQNFPEGTAVSLPLRALGMRRRRSFFFGQLSAVVEPISAVIGAAAVMVFQPALPYVLAFAAGAMIYVVVEEVIPETQRDKYADTAVMSLIIGFVVMMILDVAG